MTRTEAHPETDHVLWEAIQQEVASRPEAFLFKAYDWELSQVSYSEDLSKAVVWLDPLDPITGMTIATEPMTVIAVLAPGGSSSESSDWQVVFQEDEAWKDTAPGLLELLPQELAVEWDEALKAPEAPLAALGGYKLPWASGLTKNLVWSAEHTSCGEGYCTYALDFADGTMFPMLAAKGGTVFYATDNCENGDPDCTNIFIIRDVSTSPTSYQIYYHLARNTIPSSLHSLGTPVAQGQYIGNADDTGYSSGHHLHFMVHTSTYGYWGTSVDITFRDVSINWDSATQGGRPRTQAGAGILGGQWQSSYTSGNVGANPPTGGLTLPSDKQTVTTQGLLTSGWGTDNLSVTRFQLLAYYDDSWHDVGAPQTSNPFTYNLDLCSSAIPIGPFDLALRVWDYEGNQTITPLSVRHLVNAVTCTTQGNPVCLPNSEQVAVYSGINFSGACKLLGIGVHNNSQFAPVSNNDIASIIVGDLVQIRMYDGETWGNRRDTLTNTDRNLENNPINLDYISSASVQYRYVDPSMVIDEDNDDLKTPHGPSSAAPTNFDSIMLTWQSHGATKYRVKVVPWYLSSTTECESATPVLERTPTWDSPPSWSIGSLSTGEYTVCVRGRISEMGGEAHYSGWVMKTFPVTNISLPIYTTRTLPYAYDVEAGTGDWTNSGLWRRIPDSWNSNNDLWACNNTDNDYGDQTYGGGDLTSPPIQIPAGETILRFDYRYETEGDQVFWDQRWVQISQNGSRFQNLVQLSDDAMNTWLTSSAIDLSAYANSIVRVRFHFSIVDPYYNGEREGWLVDNISVRTTTPQGCEESSNDTVTNATQINLNDAVIAEVCPAGDVDYYAFSATEGERLIASVEALQMSPSSLLDTHLTLLDQTKYGNSPININDDLQPGVMTDSRLYIQIPETGEYYLKVKSDDHPSSGGSNYFYTISITEHLITSDEVAPTLAMIYPTTEDGVPAGIATFSALSEDLGSGINRVEFWWHSPNWTSGQWQLQAEDTYANDGWNAPFDGSAYVGGQSGALAVISYDNEENASLAVQWDVAIDDTPPVTSLKSLPVTTDGTGILLSWNAADALSRLAGYDIQFQVDGSDWQTWKSNIPAAIDSTWFVGEPGHTYAFRMRGFDTPGNLEPFPPEAEVTTQTAAACTIDAFDGGGGDNEAGSAVPLQPDVYLEHNYCGVGDVDWSGFFAQTGQEFLISVLPDSQSPAGSTLDLYQSSESGWLMQTEAYEIGAPISLRWIAPADGLYLIRLTPKAVGVSGNNTGYRIRVGNGIWFDFPIISR